MKKYIIKSIIFNDYFMNLEPTLSKHYNIFWTTNIDFARKFTTKPEANTALGMLQGMTKDDLGLTILEVNDYE